MSITLVKELAPGLVILNTSFGQQTWALARTRKAQTCIITEERFSPGSDMYRPTTNKGNRMERISTLGMEVIARRNP
jgi:hypothetical protein